jgi:hypothetical protein
MLLHVVCAACSVLGHDGGQNTACSIADIVGKVRKCSPDCMEDAGIAIHSRWRLFRSRTLGLHHPRLSDMMAPMLDKGGFVHWLLGCSDVEELTTAVVSAHRPLTL